MMDRHFKEMTVIHPPDSQAVHLHWGCYHLASWFLMKRLLKGRKNRIINVFITPSPSPRNPPPMPVLPLTHVQPLPSLLVPFEAKPRHPIISLVNIPVSLKGDCISECLSAPLHYVFFSHLRPGAQAWSRGHLPSVVEGWAGEGVNEPGPGVIAVDPRGGSHSYLSVS